MTACDTSPDVPVLDGPWARRESALEAYCEAEVEGTGLVDVEQVYLPSVVACENGGADFAALQAQAVAARSYLYYKLDRSGRIGDGQQDQVFTCGRGPNDAHREAVRSTAGIVLTYADAPIAAFYVAGAIPSTEDCRPAPGDDDPTSTERWVTYNEGRAGADIAQTELGWVNPSNTANRGCKSQNGADCLAERGYTWDQIVRFYYGEDIGVLQTAGACVSTPPPPPPVVDAAAMAAVDAATVAFPDAAPSGAEDAAAALTDDEGVPISPAPELLDAGTRPTPRAPTQGVSAAGRCSAAPGQGDVSLAGIVGWLCALVALRRPRRAS